MVPQLEAIPTPKTIKKDNNTARNRSFISFLSELSDQRLLSPTGLTDRALTFVAGFVKSC